MQKLEHVIIPGWIIAKLHGAQFSYKTIIIAIIINRSIINYQFQIGRFPHPTRNGQKYVSSISHIKVSSPNSGNST
jgi:hypothetical protein